MTRDDIFLSAAAVYAAMSSLTALTYGWDKLCAKRGAWRVPEATLHLLALFCGWPGALVAQQVFRHKSQKTSFRVVFWLTVILNLAAVGAAGWFLLR